MGTKMCRISVRTTLVFDPKVDIPEFLVPVLFLKKVFPNGGTLAQLGPMGPPWAPWAPWGPMGLHGAQCSQFSNFGKNFFHKKYSKIQNVNFGGENQSCSRRNSAHFGTHTVPWGPLFDHFPGFNDFVKIGQNGPIPQTVQIWPSGQVSGLESQGWGARFDSWCMFLGVSGAAQRFFPREK